MAENSMEIRLDAEHQSLSDRIISEHDLCILLGISARTLDNLRREEKLPTVYLNRTNRVYEVSGVLDWLSKRMKV